MPVYGSGVVPASGSITNELTAVMRRAFVPKLVVQIYSAAPVLSLLMRNAQRARGGLSQVTVPVPSHPYAAALLPNVTAADTAPAPPSLSGKSSTDVAASAGPMSSPGAGALNAMLRGNNRLAVLK